MSDWASKSWQKAMVWKLAIVRCVLFSLITLGTAIQTACISINYAAMPPQEKILLWIGIIVLWGNQMLSFLEKTSENISKGKPPFAQEVQTEQWLKQQKENG